MIDYGEVFKQVRNIVKDRVQNKIPSRYILNENTSGVKPNKLYATIQVIGTYDANSFLTNKRYDDVSEEMSYETHKDIEIRIKIGNGNPKAYEDDIETYTLSNNLHKAFVEETVLDTLYSELGATVRSVSPIRTSPQYHNNGYSSTQIFVLTITMSDVTTEAMAPIDSISVVGNSKNADGSTTQSDIESP